MLFRCDNFKSMAFLQKPCVIEFDGYRIEYLGFCRKEFRGRAPIFFIGGAFQNFFSFKKEVQVLMQERPVVLIDLPSQGSNQQLASQLKFDDFAILLKKFCDHFEIQKIIPIALSYGSATAYSFATLFPERVEKMILGGTTSCVRESIRKLLLESIRVLKEGDQSLFAEGAVLNLINFGHRQETQINSRIIKGFFKNMKSLKENCIQRYIDNTNRLLEISSLDGTIQCPTLVLTGEYDSFTTPHENFQVAKLIEDSQMALIENADHLANLERRDELMKLYTAFLAGRSIDNIEGIRSIDLSKEEIPNKRLNPRKQLTHTYAELTDNQNVTVQAKIEDINYFGCKLSFDENSETNLNLEDELKFDFHKDLDELNKLNLSGFIFGDQKDRCIFKKGSFQNAERLEKYLESLN